ncbi:cysteine protease ATG4B [Chrysoperla carnea]|uniref:cysteine protease ATG4B n=1 Tax=Chrysoperla carnea TaxID=189513 RepID=UPI001D083677|nr:cysteine protease ATG4B [Chrysoperla carnea]
MDCMFEAYLTHESVNFEPDDIPQTSEPVWILGKKYNATQELEIIRRDILSKLWFTYRKGFVPIGGCDGLTSDKGWGCMLRCGQMVLAQALITLHLSKNWFWTPETRDATYLQILSKFEDRRQAPYSIHQIAQMGKSEGKDIGQWFGPNTVAQVLKKLVKYDDWSCIEIHVALDNTIIIEDIKQLCNKTTTRSKTTSDNETTTNKEWKPLLLIIPLRLGLSEINKIYIDSLKQCFEFEQSLGVIGGKPNLALYFIGYVGDDVIYLDPHTTQKYALVENKLTDEQCLNDLTYHCKYANRIPIISIDPSIAIAFFCATEFEFDTLCTRIQNELIVSDKQPLFELSETKPKQWYHFDETATTIVSTGTTSSTATTNLFNTDQFLIEHQDFSNSDDDFEIIG